MYVKRIIVARTGRGILDSSRVAIHFNPLQSNICSSKRLHIVLNCCYYYEVSLNVLNIYIYIYIYINVHFFYVKFIGHITSKSHPVKILIITELQIAFDIKMLSILLIYPHTKFHIPRQINNC